jgi:hypothetical protein
MYTMRYTNEQLISTRIYTVQEVFLNRHQFEMSDERREKLVRDFIGNNKGCNKEDVIRGLKKDLSRKTVRKKMNALEEKGEVEDRKEKHSRESKLFLKLDNPLVSAMLELEEFETYFLSLFSKAREKVGDSMKMKAFDKFAKSRRWKLEKSSDVLPPLDQDQLLSESLSIFYHMVNSYMIRSIMVWPILINDKKIVNKLYEKVLMNIANILKKIAKIDEDDIAPLLTSRNEYIITQTLGGAATLMGYRKLFTKYGMQQEIEAVIDSLWKMDKDIQKYAYMEPRAFHFKFRYGIDGWRELLDFAEQRLDM